MAMAMPIMMIAGAGLSVASAQEKNKNANNAKKAQYAWQEVDRKKGNLVRNLSAAQEAGSNYTNRMEIAESAALTQRQNMSQADARLQDQVTATSQALANSMSQQTASFAARGVAGGASLKALQRQTRRQFGQQTADLIMNTETEKKRISGQFEAAQNQMDAMTVTTPQWQAQGQGPQTSSLGFLDIAASGLSGAQQGASMGQSLGFKPLNVPGMFKGAATPAADPYAGVPDLLRRTD